MNFARKSKAAGRYDWRNAIPRTRDIQAIATGFTRSVNRQWEMAEFQYRPPGWPQARRFVVARRFIPDEETQSTLVILGRYEYRACVHGMFLFSGTRGSLILLANPYSGLAMTDGSKFERGRKSL